MAEVEARGAEWARGSRLRGPVTLGPVRSAALRSHLVFLPFLLPLEVLRNSEARIVRADTWVRTLRPRGKFFLSDELGQMPGL